MHKEVTSHFGWRVMGAFLVIQNSNFPMAVTKVSFNFDGQAGFHYAENGPEAE